MRLIIKTLRLCAALFLRTAKSCPAEEVACARGISASSALPSSARGLWHCCLLLSSSCMSVLPSLNSIKVGLTILFGGEPYQVQTANFVRMQQRKPVMQTRLKNLINGKVLEYSFKAGEKVEEAALERKKCDYLYTAQSGMYFMDAETYEQFTIAPELLEGRVKLLKDGMRVDVLYFNEKPITVCLPPKIDLKVVSAPPSIKGDSASNVTKQVTLETGLMVNVPLFVKEGDTIRVNTDTLEYAERVTQVAAQGVY